MPTRKRDERGAVLPEYALVFAAFTMGIIGVAQVIHERTADFYEGSSSGIGAVPEYEVSRTTLGWSPTTTLPVTIPTTTTTTTTTTIPATTTSTTSTPSSTSTTVTTPPTTSGPTTTVTPTVNTFVFNLEDRSYNESDGDWRARARISLHRSDTGGNLSGALVSGRFVTADGNTRDRTCTTDPVGQCQMDWGIRNDNDDPTTFTVTNVSSTPGWDGVQASISLEKP